MGSVLSAGTSLVSLGCQSLTCCCSMTNCCMNFGGGFSGMSIRNAKIVYISLVGLAAVLAFILRLQGENLNINLGPWNVHCKSTDVELGTTENDIYPILNPIDDQYIYCKGDAAVFRISFVMSCFFAAMTVGSLTNAAFHRSFWGLKCMGLVLGFLICFFIPNSFFDNTGWAWIARVGSICFLSLQILILIDFAYKWNESWVAKALEDGDDNNFWLIAILSCVALLYLLVLSGIPLLLVFYGDCGLGVGFSIVTFVGIIILTLITLTRDKIVGEDHEGAVLPAAVVSLYVTYLCWSALESNPDFDCKPASTFSSSTVQIVIGTLFAVGSLCWTCFSVTNGVEDLLSGKSTDGEGSDAAVPLYSGLGDNGENRTVDVEACDSDDLDGNEAQHLWIFHCTLLTASMYMGMLLTNWGADPNALTNVNGHVGLASAWIKFCSAVLTMCLYVWTLVAPRVLQDRDF